MKRNIALIRQTRTKPFILSALAKLGAKYNSIIVMTLIVLFGAFSFTSKAQGEIDTLQHSQSKKLLVDYYNHNFDPFKKGTWFTKASFSLNDQSRTNYPRLFDEIVEGDSRSWNLSVSGGNYVSDNLMLGLGVNYKESFFEGELLDADSELIFRQSLSQEFSLSPYMRVSIPITANNRLSVYNDFGLFFGKGTGLHRETMHLDEITKQYSKHWNIGVGLSPGITCFVVEDFAFDLGVNLLGYRMQVEDIKNGDEEDSRSVDHDVNFKLNILTLNFGVSYYF